MSPNYLILAFGFGNLVMLGWLAAAALPIIIHFWSRRRYQEAPWAAIEFLLEAMRKNARRINIQHWLLLAVRTLLIVAVVLAIAKPFLEQALVAGDGRGPTHFVLVLDASFSMAYRPAEASLFEQAKQRAAELVEESRTGDSFSLVLLADPPQVILGPPVADDQRVTREIGQLALTDGGADLRATLAAVSETLATGREVSPGRAQQVVFFTDLGNTTWQAAVATPTTQASSTSADALSADPPAAVTFPGSAAPQLAALAEQAALVVVDLGSSGAENVAVTRLAATTPYFTTGRPVTLSATLANFGGRARADQRVELLIDDVAVAEQGVDLAPGAATEVSFSHRFEAPGEHVATVRTSGDALAVDNLRWLAVPIEQQLRVLCVAGGRGAATYVAHALDPSPSGLPSEAAILPVVISDGALVETDLSDYRCVVLCNVPQFTDREVALLEQYLRGSGGLVFFLGDRVIASRYNELLAPAEARAAASDLRGGPAAADGTSGGEASAVNAPILPARLGPLVTEPSYGLDPLDYRHPIVVPFRGRERAGLLTTSVYRYFRLEMPDDSPAPAAATSADGDEPTESSSNSPLPAASVALALAGGDPLIVTAPVHRGRTILVATAGSLASVDEATGQPWTTLPAWPSFLPLVREMVSYAMGRDADRFEATVGQMLGGPLPADVAIERVEVLRPDGGQETVRPESTPGGGEWIYGPAERRGVYGVSMVPEGAGTAEVTALRRIAVNVDPAESNLAKVNRSALPPELVVQDDWRGGTSFVSAGASGGVIRRGGMHRWLLAAAMALALFETFLAWRFGRTAA